MNTDGTGFNTCKGCHKTKSLWNHTATDHKEGEQLEDRRNVGESSCNFGDGTDQRVQSLMFMMMMMIMMMILQTSKTRSSKLNSVCKRDANFKQEWPQCWCQCRYLAWWDEACRKIPRWPTVIRTHFCSTLHMFYPERVPLYTVQLGARYSHF